MSKQFTCPLGGELQSRQPADLAQGNILVSGWSRRDVKAIFSLNKSLRVRLYFQAEVAIGNLLEVVLCSFLYAREHPFGKKGKKRKRHA